ncbi:alpha/beta hydrolase-fold protein [Dactylosporangium sp. AC04546]|uniref:alpha/beta hydrolase n=1 Tax=Dactylosporangium sp. AC04546 TaxID=2862460 RepID=UPI001EDCADED|nr:alpha/beta hydrolase-fold protein [Dactylosporangium sp. AC04546]WVK88812.1 alpha/beta hydrolase-fold protein [Dactylosporangium sp. AC04546]
MRIYHAEQPTHEVAAAPERTRHRRPRGRRADAAVAAVAAGLVAAGLTWATWDGAFDHVPLLDRAVAGGFEVVGCALLLAALSSPERRWITRTLPILLLSVTGLVALVALTLWITGTVTDAYPPSFAIWVGAGFAALAGCPLVLRRRPVDRATRPADGRTTGRTTGGTAGRALAWRKAAAVVAVPATIAGAFMQIDQQYGIWPQLGDVLGHSGAISGQQAHDLIGGAATPGSDPPAHGVIVSLDAPASRSHFSHRPGVVFLPPAYFGPGRPTLPVLIMLVGSPGTPINWLRSGHGQSTDDAYAAAHNGRAPVLVVVDQNGSATGDTECIDGPRGNAETYLTVDVPAFITGTLRIQHNPSRWGIAGFSEGGTCALDLVLGHPDIYRHVIDFGGDARPNLGDPAHTLSTLFGGSLAAERAHDPAWLLSTRRYPGVTLWFGAGAGDARDIAVGEQLAAAAVRDGIVTHRFVDPGGHNWQFASAGFAGVLPQLCDEMVTGGLASRLVQPLVQRPR